MYQLDAQKLVSMLCGETGRGEASELELIAYFDALARYQAI